MASIRKKGRKQMEFLLPGWIEDRDRRGRAARLADAQQTAGGVSKDDVAFAIPRSAHGEAGEIAQRLRQTSGYVQLLEFAAGIKREEPPVGRPERRRRE